MNRRSFFRSLAATAGALVLPYEPKRVYSFGEGVGAWLPDDEPFFGVDRTAVPVFLRGRLRSDPPMMYVHPDLYARIKNLGEPDIIVGGIKYHVWPS